MKYIINIALAISLIIAICSFENSGSNTGGNIANNIKFTSVFNNYRFIKSYTPFNLVIKTNEDALKFINDTKTDKNDCLGKPLKVTLPSIDFTKEMFIAVCYGTSPSGNMKLQINSVSESESKIT